MFVLLYKPKVSDINFVGYARKSKFTSRDTKVRSK